MAVPREAPLYAWSGPYVDVPRTELLLDEVFLHRGDLPQSGRWRDRTVSVNLFYARAYWALVQTAALVDDEPSVVRYVEEAQAWESLGRLVVEEASE